MSAKPTTGPWHTSDVGNGLVIYDETGWAVANAAVPHARATTDEGRANARLIAAAPDLLEALVDLAEAGEDAWGPDRPCVRIALRAIAKAIGKKGQPK